MAINATMADTGQTQEIELLFFDTFQHDHCKDVNLDLVQFQHPVLINEVRIIPLGVKVVADVPGGARLGATNPSLFKLEMYVNNLMKPNAATFEKLGVLDYHGDRESNMLLDHQRVATDGLILKGWYSMLTVAVFGTVTHVAKDRNSPPPPPPPQHRADNDVLKPPEPSDKSPYRLEPVDIAHELKTLEPVSVVYSDGSQMQSSVTPTKMEIPQMLQPPEPATYVHQNPTDVSGKDTSTSDLDNWALTESRGTDFEKIDQLEQKEIELKRDSDISRDSRERDHEHRQSSKDRDRDSSRESRDRERYREQTHSSRERGTLHDSRENIRERDRDRLHSSTERDNSREARDRVRERHHDSREREKDNLRDSRDRDRAKDREKSQSNRKKDREDSRESRDKDRGRDRHHDNREQDWDVYRTNESSADRSWPKSPPHRPSRSRSRSARRSRTRSGSRRSKSPKRRSWSRSPRRSWSRSPRSSRSRRSRSLSHRSRDSCSHGRSRSPCGSRPRSPGSNRTRSPARSRSSPGRGRSPINRGKNSQGKWSRSPGSNRGSPIRRSRSPGRPHSPSSRSRTPHEGHPRSPGRRSRSPSSRIGGRIRSPSNRSLSIGLRSVSPGGRPKSPGVRPRSPSRRSRSPGSHGGRPRSPCSPDHRSRTPESRPRSPDSRPRSPRRRSWSPSARPRSPTGRQRSPGRIRSPRRSRSPPCRPRSPGGRLFSPGRRSFSPRSPGGRIRSPGSRGRPRSPGGRGWSPMHPASPSGRPHSPRRSQSPPQWPIQTIRSMHSPGRHRSPGPYGHMMPHDMHGPIHPSMPPMENNPPMNYRPQFDPHMLPPDHHVLPNYGVDMMMPGIPPPEMLPHHHLHHPPPQTGPPYMMNQFEALSADEEGIDVSEGELPEMEGDGYEEILSDEDIMSDVDENELQVVDMDMEIPDDLMLEYNYNPYQFELSTLTTINSPGLTDYQIEQLKLKQKGCPPKKPTEAEQILEIVKTYKDQPHHADWIEAMERLPELLSVGLAYLVQNEKREDVADTLTDWVVEGLDVEKGIAQPDAKYKLRHLKMGINLAGVFCSCDGDIALKMMIKDTQHKLLDMYLSENMSISLKVQILRAVDLSTRLNEGIQWFLGKNPMQANIPHKHDETAYQRLVKIMLSKQLVRAMVSISPLIRKMHVYELIGKFQHLAEGLVENNSDIDAEGTADEELEGITHTVGDIEAEPVISILDEIVSIQKAAKHLIAQPTRTLPAKVQFAVSKEPYDPYPNLYHMFNSGHLLESVFLLISSPITFNHQGIFVSVKELLLQLMATNEGLKFLASQTDVTNGMIRVLIQTQDNVDETPEGTPAHTLGLQLCYSMHVMEIVDLLTEYNLKDDAEKLIDEPEIMTLLHTMFMMTFSAQGREQVVHVLSQADNLGVLIPFVDVPDPDQEALMHRMKKSVDAMYVSHLLVIVVRETLSMNVLEKYAVKLLKLSDLDMNSKLNDLQEWLAPTRCMTDYSFESLPLVLTHLKQYNEEITELPRGLITTLKILQHWAISPLKETLGGREELKYKYVISELFNAECMQIFTNILQKITDLVRRPWQEGSYLSIGKGLRAIAMIKPTVALVKVMQCSLINARGAACKDVTHVPILFNVHTVMCSAPPTGQLSEAMQTVQQNILDTLLAYTQPTLEHSEDALNDSLWTKMLQELLKYSLTVPYTAVSGLMLLSELLPLPLPVQTKEPLNEEEILIATNTRKLWSAHMLCCSSEINIVIKTFATSSCAPLQNVLRRVCWQIADMSAPCANLVMKCLLECLNPLPEIPKDGKDNETPEVIPPVTPETAQLLSCVAHLITYPSIKSTMLDMILPGSKNEEMSALVLSKLLLVLNVACDRSAHLQAQECIVSILQTLCDPEITMTTGDNVQEPMQLATAMPHKEILSQVSHSLLIHISHMDHNYSSILLALRTLVMLLEHNYGFLQLNHCLENMPSIFYSLFMRINNTFSKDSSDCLSTLSTATEFLRLLVTIDNDEERLFTRTKTMTVTDLRKVLSWMPETSGDHPLGDLEKLLVDCAKEEEMLESLLEGTQSLLQIIQTDDAADKTEDESEEFILPEPIPVTVQFASRPIFLITDSDDDRLNANYWLNYPVDESDPDVELIRCDFEEMCHKFCADFDLKAELLKGSLPSETHKPKKKQRNPRHRDTINTSSTRGRGRRSTFIAPMRGRGFGRMNQSNRPNDPFRSRPPNTSRPPSMHVDDFVKFEGNGPTSSTATSGKEFNGGRGGRGGRNFERSRGGSGRGRFFSPPGSYGRRDGGRQPARGGIDSRGPSGRGGSSRGGSRGTSQWGGRSKNVSPRGFGSRGRDSERIGDRRGARDSGPRFGSRGNGRGRGGQWGSPRKDPDSRFNHPPPLPPVGGFRGGRRDELRGGRHARSYTK